MNPAKLENQPVKTTGRQSTALLSENSLSSASLRFVFQNGGGSSPIAYSLWPMPREGGGPSPQSRVPSPRTGRAGARG